MIHVFGKGFFRCPEETSCDHKCDALLQKKAFFWMRKKISFPNSYLCCSFNKRMILTKGPLLGREKNYLFNKTRFNASDDMIRGQQWYDPSNNSNRDINDAMNKMNENQWEKPPWQPQFLLLCPSLPVEQRAVKTFLNPRVQPPQPDTLLGCTHLACRHWGDYNQLTSI